MRNSPGSRRGQALVVALVVLVFLLPMGIVLYNSAISAQKSAVVEGQQKMSAQMATDIVSDYMRQFSNDPYNGHYDDASLGRPPTGYYANSVSSVNYVANASSHTVYLDIVAGTGSGSYTSLAHPKRVQVLIAFISNLVLYGTMFNSSTALSAGNVTYSGGFYVNGDFSESGNNVTFEGGPVIVNGAASATGASDLIDTNIYYVSGTNSGFTITGQAYNFVPSFTWPTFDTSYYAANSATTTAVTQTITFLSTGQYQMSKTGAVKYTIPSSGVIIYANNANLNISGTVSGKVTVVAYASNNALGCGAGSGQINVTGNLEYAGATPTTASPSGAFAALASNCIEFNSASNLTVAGVYFVQGTAATAMEANYSGGGSGVLVISGTRSDPIYNSGFGTVTIAYDPGLRANQPPGLPEQAYIVNYNVR